MSRNVFPENAPSLRFHVLSFPRVGTFRGPFPVLGVAIEFQLSFRGNRVSIELISSWCLPYGLLYF
jgi:hypothetical protein